MTRFLPTLILSSLLIPAGALAQNSPEAPKTPPIKTSAQGYVTYREFQTFENDQSLSPFWKKQADLTVLELKGEYAISPRSEFEFEIEFEHGGTGSAVEYDGLEEFGEFEGETEKGGEVALSEFYYKYKFSENTRLKAGKIPVRISLGNMQDNYLMYPSVNPSDVELFMLPYDWRELGAEVLQKVGPFSATLAVVNGLNSEFFRTYNWVGGGYQKRTEEVNAGNLALHSTLQWGDMTKGDGIGIAGYYGDTTDNRFKRGKVSASGQVLLYSVMGVYHWMDLGVRFQHIEGSLQNSDKISNANATLIGQAAPGNFSSLGHTARLSSIELSYEALKSDEASLTGFASYQMVNTMLSVEGTINKSDRYNRLVTSLGLCWRFEKVMFLKLEGLQYSTAMDGLPDTKEYRMALGFDLAHFN
jgi:hypothetical protein